MKKGFTLIELIVVMALIGILTSVVLVSIGGARKNARQEIQQKSFCRMEWQQVEVCK